MWSNPRRSGSRPSWPTAGDFGKLHGLPAHDLDTLRTFCVALHRCFRRRTDALRALIEARLAADSVRSLLHLSGQAPHRRGWDSLYDALTAGRIDVALLRALLRRHLTRAGPPVYPVNLSVWPRCDAKASRERDFYYHPSRYAAGQPIVAGWAYQGLAPRSFDRDGWTAPLDIGRLHPNEKAHPVAVEQLKALTAQQPGSDATPLFGFDAGYDSAQLTQALARTPGAILVRWPPTAAFRATRSRQARRRW